MKLDLAIGLTIMNLIHVGSSSGLFHAQEQQAQLLPSACKSVNVLVNHLISLDSKKRSRVDCISLRVYSRVGALPGMIRVIFIISLPRVP